MANSDWTYEILIPIPEKTIRWSIVMCVCVGAEHRCFFSHTLIFHIVIYHIAYTARCRNNLSDLSGTVPREFVEASFASLSGCRRDLDGYFHLQDGASNPTIGTLHMHIYIYLCMYVYK